MRQEKILLLDENSTRREENRQYLQELGQVLDADLGSDPKTWAAQHNPTLVVASMPVPRGKFRQLLKALMERPNRPFSLFLLEPGQTRQATEALDMGADEIMRPPFSVRELYTRLQLLASRRRREHLGRPDTPGSGRLSEISVRELVDLFVQGGGTATVHLHSHSDRARLVFKEGKLISATLDHRQGMDALVRLLRWDDGHFESLPELPDDDFGALDQPDPLKKALAALADWDEKLRHLPPLDQPVQVRFLHVQNNLDSLSTLAEQLLWQLASHRSLGKLIDSFDGDLSAALAELQELYAQDYFHPSEEATESKNAIGFTDSTAALAGLAHQSQDLIDAHQSNFKDRLANAAQEAAAQLMAAAKPVATPADPIDRDKYPSFLELPLPSSPSLSSAPAVGTQNSRNTLDSLFGPGIDFEFNLPSSSPGLAPASSQGEISGAEVAASDLSTTEISPSFELDDFKSLTESDQPLPTEEDGADEWPGPARLTLPSPTIPATTRTDLTATPKSVEELIESSEDLEDPQTDESNQLFSVNEELPGEKISDLFSIQEESHSQKEASLPSMSLFPEKESSGSLPTGEFDSLAGQDAPFHIPAVEDQPLDGDTVTFSIGTEDTHAQTDAFPMLPQELVEDSDKSSAKMTLPLRAITPAEEKSTEEPEEPEYPIPEEMLVQNADTIATSSTESSESEDVKQLLRAETLDILGKLVQTELTHSHKDTSSTDALSPGMTIALGQSAPSQDALHIPAVDEPVSPGMTLAIGQAVPASQDDLQSIPAPEPVKPAASYTLEFDAPADHTDTPDRTDDTSRHAEFDVTPNQTSPLKQTDDFGVTEPPPAQEAAQESNAPFVRKPRPPSLEIPAPQEDLHIGPSPFGVSDELRLSDEFFLHEDDLLPRKRNRVKSFFFWTFIGIFFAGIGFLGMAMYARYQQGKNPWPFGAETNLPVLPRTPQARPRVARAPAVTRRQPTTPRLGTTPAAITQVTDGGTPSTPTPGTAPVERRTVAPVERRPEEVRPEVRTPEPPRVAPRPVVVRRPTPRVVKPVRRPTRVARRTTPPRRTVRSARVRGGSSQQRAMALYREALSQKKRERFRNAERLLRRALRLKPSNPAPIYSALGQVLYEREQTRSAVQYLLRAYRISPRQTGAGLVTLGSIYYERGKRARARTIYRQYLKYYPRGRHAEDVKAMLRN